MAACCLLLGPLGLSACGEEAETDEAPAEAPHPFSDCEAPAAIDTELRAAECDAWRSGGQAVSQAGTEAAAAAADHVTHDGYRLRRLTSLTLLGLTGLLLGGLLGALGRAGLRRRRRPTYAKVALAALAKEIGAIRALGESGDPLLGHLIERLDAPLSELEARAGEIARRAEPLARQAGDNATSRAHVEALFDQLDLLLSRAERVHVQASVWRERLGVDADDSLEEAVAGALEDLQSGLEETA